MPAKATATAMALVMAMAKAQVTVKGTAKDSVKAMGCSGRRCLQS